MTAMEIMGVHAMKTPTWITLLLLAVSFPCLAQGDRLPPKGEGDEGWRDEGPREPGHDREHPPRDPREPRDGGPRPKNPPPPHPPRQLTAEEAEEVVEFLRSWDPYRLKRLEGARERSPHEYMGILQESFFEMRRVQELQRTDPEAYESMKKERSLEMESFEIGEQIRATEDPAKRDELKAKLKPILAELFDLREKHKDQEIKRLEKELNRLKEQVERRRKNKDAIVERRLRELSGEQLDDEW